MSGGAEKILAQNRAQADSGFLVCFPMRLDWETARGDAAAEAYPAPRVSSRDGAEPPGGWPAAVTTLEREAAAQGWDVERAYAAGRAPHGTTAKPLAERETYSVRFRSGAWQGYAIYAGGSSPGWASIMVTGAALPPFGAMNRTELSAWLAGPEPAGSVFYDMVRERVRRQEADRKARESCNRGVHDSVFVTAEGMLSCGRCDHEWAPDEQPWRKPKGRGDAS